MAYTLQAIIGDAATLRGHCPIGATVLTLQQGKAMVPLSPRLLRETHIPSLPLTDIVPEGFWDALNRFVSPLVGHGRFAYIETEYFGGTGTQACVTWNEKGDPSVPSIQPCAVHAALRFIGVQIGEHRDELDALNLGSIRSMEECETGSMNRLR